MNYKFIIIIILIIYILWIYCEDTYESFECNNQSSASDQLEQLGQTAKDACNKISSRAEEIKADRGGVAGIIDSALSFFSPNNYKSGDNSSTDVMRNIINTNLSECDIMKIENSCRNTAASVQSNIIDNTKCPACSDIEILKIYPNICSVSNVTQENNSVISQTCTIQSAIETLLKKTSSIDSQALANVLQEATGVLSGSNTSSGENCDVINNDMSSKSYMEHRSECANEITVDQKNHLGACGPVTGVIQKNQYANLQTCLMGTDVKKESSASGITDIEKERITKQKSDSNLSASCAALGGFVVLLAIVAIVSASDVAKDKGFQETTMKAMELKTTGGITSTNKLPISK